MRDTYPDLEQGEPTKERRQRLIAAAQEAWEAQGWDELRRLVDSMPRRLQAVIDADGWATKY